MRNPEIAKTIAAGKAKLAEKLETTAEDIAQEMAKLAFANMDDYMRVGFGGDPVLDFTNLTRAQKAALVEVTVDDYVDGRGAHARDVKRVKFKLADKRASLIDLARLLGHLTEKHELKHTGAVGVLTAERVKAMTDQELAAEATRLAAETEALVDKLAKEK